MRAKTVVNQMPVALHQSITTLIDSKIIGIRQSYSYLLATNTIYCSNFYGLRNYSSLGELFKIIIL